MWVHIPPLNTQICDNYQQASSLIQIYRKIKGIKTSVNTSNCCNPFFHCLLKPGDSHDDKAGGVQAGVAAAGMGPGTPHPLWTSQIKQWQTRQQMRRKKKHKKMKEKEERWLSCSARLMPLPSAQCSARALFCHVPRGGLLPPLPVLLCPLCPLAQPHRNAVPSQQHVPKQRRILLLIISCPSS